VTTHSSGCFQYTSESLPPAEAEHTLPCSSSLQNLFGPSQRHAQSWNANHLLSPVLQPQPLPQPLPPLASLSHHSVRRSTTPQLSSVVMEPDIAVSAPYSGSSCDDRPHQYSESFGDVSRLLALSSVASLQLLDPSHNVIESTPMSTAPRVIRNPSSYTNILGLARAGGMAAIRQEGQSSATITPMLTQLCNTSGDYNITCTPPLPDHSSVHISLPSLSFQPFSLPTHADAITQPICIPSAKSKPVLTRSPRYSNSILISSESILNYECRDVERGLGSDQIPVSSDECPCPVTSGQMAYLTLQEVRNKRLESYTDVCSGHDRMTTSSAGIESHTQSDTSSEVYPAVSAIQTSRDEEVHIEGSAGVDLDEIWSPISALVSSNYASSPLCYPTAILASPLLSQEEKLPS
jgi:hypothetical protein